MNRWLWIIPASLIFAGWQWFAAEEEVSLRAEDLSYQRTVINKTEENAVETLVNPEPLTIKVVLKQHYLDGVTETIHKEETIWSMVDFWSAYEGWSIESQELDQIVFKRQVKDISPLTKQQGYFGLTEDGELAVFEGAPSEGKVIESFKPIPIEPLESKRKSELKDGIKIKDASHFEQVVKQYAGEEQPL
ncbi:MAG: intercompartmental signaling factor BofC [Halobacillus sp.]|uniref:BofC C-terminal domain-containing protein n=1 Tax=Halobacillus sp. TaxID=56800 RepID=UPI003BB11F1C